MARMSRLLASRLLAELPRELDAFRQAGIPVPEIRISHPDMLTRDAATKLLDWARGIPGFYDLLMGRGEATTGQASGAGNSEKDRATAAKNIRLYLDLVNHFAVDHPQAPSGDPEPWGERLPVIDPTAENPFAELTPQEARDLQRFAEAQPEWNAAINDKSHPEYAACQRQLDQVLERATLPDAPAPAEPASQHSQPQEETPAMAAKTGAHPTIAELMKDPAYFDKSHPGHRAAVDRVTAAYEAKSGAAPAAPRQRAAGEISAEFAKDPAYTDKSHPGHAAAVERATAAFAQAYPETPAASSGGNQA